MLAGINSSAKEQEAGKNEHMRAFDVKYPPRKKLKTEAGNQSEKGQWKQVGKRSLFKTPEGAKKEIYQRILRLSPSKQRESGSKRIGAIATGLAKNSEVIVFNATNPVPDEADVLTRIQLDDRQEAADLDIIEPGESEFSVAYCTDEGIHEQTLKYDFKTKRTEKTPKGPRRVYHMPYPDTLESPNSRLKFRSLRFLNAQNIVALCNKPNKSGAELRVFHLYPTGPATLIQEHKLPSHMKQAVSMDVCALDADKDGNQQFVIAVAGQDISLEVFTTNYQRQTDTFSSFRSYITIQNVHQHQMTKICFSPFHSPARAPSAASQKTGKDGEPAQLQKSDPLPQPVAQYVRLASVSYGNTVLVDTFPLQPLDLEKKDSRHVLSHPSDEKFAKYTYIFVISIIVLVFAFLIQSFVGDFSGENARGPFSKILPKSVLEFLDKPAAAAYGREVKWVPAASLALSSNMPSSAEEAKGRLQSLLDRHELHPSSSSSSAQSKETSDPQQEKEKTLIVRSAPENMGGVTVDVHPDKEAYREKNTEAKHWHELEEHQKAGWRERLRQAGQWAEGEGEAVLTGILFSEYAGLVGEGVGEMLREL